MTTFRLDRLDHVSLNVSDRARSIAWYRDVLGLRLMNKPGADDWPTFMGKFGSCIGLFQAQSGPAVTREPESVGLRHVAFMLGSEDFDGAVWINASGCEHFVTAAQHQYDCAATNDPENDEGRMTNNE